MSVLSFQCKHNQSPWCLQVSSQDSLSATQRNCVCVPSCGIMSEKSELKAELERKKQRLAQIREEKKRKEEERKKKEVWVTLCKCVQHSLAMRTEKYYGEETHSKPLVARFEWKHDSIHRGHVALCQLKSICVYRQMLKVYRNDAYGH